MQVVLGQEEDALQVLRALIGVVPEALTNTVIVYLRQGKFVALFVQTNQLMVVGLLHRILTKRVTD